MDSNFKLQKEQTPIDLFRDTSMVNMGLHSNTAKFTNDKDYVSFDFTKDSFMLDPNDRSYKYDGAFTVCFWAKFKDLGHEDIAYPNKIIVSIGGEITAIEIPTDAVTVTAWNWYKIQRSDSGTVSITVNNYEIGSATSTGTFDLTDTDFIYLGNQNKHFTGFEVITDDILISEGCPRISIDEPTEYFRLLDFAKILYITSSGNVYGVKMVDDTDSEGN